MEWSVKKYISLLECINKDQVQSDAVGRPNPEAGVHFSQRYISDRGLYNEITEEAQGRLT